MSGLWISELKLSHLRSHLNAKVTVDARPVALFGPNGAGKTNLLEAISFLSPGRGLRRAAMADVCRKPEQIGWKVQASIQSNGTLHEVVTRSESGTSRTVTIDGKTRPQLALGQIARIVWLVPVMDRLWIEGAEGRRRFLDRLCLSFMPSHGEVSLKYEKAMRERNRLLKDQVPDPVWYGALERQMAEAGAQVHRNRLSAIARLTGALAHTNPAFPVCELTLEGPEGPELGEIDAEALAMAFADTRHRDIAAGRSLIGPHRSDLVAVYTAKNLPARDCSTGEQKALLLSVVLANARALQEDFGAPPLLLLDEVAAHLDTDRRSALYDEIIALGVQAWMTGTGAELFDSLGGHCQGFRVTEVDGKSLIETSALSS